MFRSKVFCVSLIVIIISVSVIGFCLYNGLSNNDDKEDTTSNVEQSTNVEQNDVVIPSVTMSTLLKYLDKYQSDVDVKYQYLDMTDSIQATLNKVKSEDWRDVFIIQDRDNGILYVRRTNDWNDLTKDSSIGFIQMTSDTTVDSICSDINSILSSYEDNNVSEDIGDAKDYGENVGITQNPDGTFSIIKD